MDRILVVVALTALTMTACTSTGRSPDTVSTKGPTTSSATEKPAAKVLTMKGLPHGDPPKIAWANGTHLNGDAAKDVLPSRVDQFAETKQLLVIRDVEGNVYAYAPDGPIGTTPIGKATGTLAINTERNLVAWIAPDGSPTVLQEGEAKPAVLAKQDGVTAGDAVAVLGHDCFNGPETVEGAGCTVFFRDLAASPPRSYASSNHGFVESVGTGTMSLQDADEHGSVGWDKLNDDQLTTCSTLIGGREWKTCDHLPLTFSPDGKHVLATSSVGFEGAGAGEIAILNRSDGKALWSIQNSPASQVFITDMVWEDDDHVLANVNDGRKAAIIRAGLDGTIELAQQPTAMDETLPNPLPLRLSVQP